MKLPLGTIILISFLCQICFSQGALPGDLCSVDADCDPLTFLECSAENKCVCQEAPNSFFDTFDNKCHKFAGDSCVRETGMPCTYNSVCYPTTLKCECNSGFFLTNNRKCARAHLAVCIQDYHCDRDQYQFCVEQKCDCIPETSIYDPELNTCVLKLYQSCANLAESQVCAPGTECLDDGTGAKCNCPTGSSDNGLGECRANQGEACNADVLCNDAKYLDCVIGFCGCDQAKHKVDDGNGGCTGDFEAPCDQGEPCDDRIFLECIGNDKCDCRSDLVNIGGVCTSNMGGTCEKGETCNADKWLKCIDKICTCDADDHMAGDGNGGCIGQINAPCDEGQQCDKGSFLDCIDGLTCNCKDGMAADINEICKSKFEGPCADGEPCDESKFLKCDQSDQKCRCPIDETIDVGAGDCKALYNKPCDVAGIVEPNCDFASNLQCVTGQCECLPGSIPIAGGRCGATLGSDCTSDTDCGTGNFLECGDDNECVCMAGFDPVNNMCFGSYGTPCDGNGVTCNNEKFLDCDAESKVCECNPGLIVIGGGVCRSAFDGVCGTDQPLCDETSYLECDEETHKCRCQDGLDPTPGVGCAVGFGASCANGELCNPAKFLECSSLDETCRCRADLIDNGEGECRLNFGGVCSDQGPPCNENGFLGCQSGTCACGRDSVYDTIQKMCVLLESASCSIDGAQLCAHNSFCEPINDADDGTGVCTCVGDLMPNPERRCFLLAGQSCNPFLDQCDSTEYQHCDPNTIKCGCIPVPNLIEEVAGRCRLMADTECSPLEGAQRCTSHASCIEVEDEGWCICDAGFIVNSVGKCVIAYGLPCGSHAQGSCDTEGLQSCHPPDAPEGQCKCSDLDSMVYDNHFKRCFVKADHQCLPGSLYACIEHATCTEGVCKCDDGFFADSHGRCVAQSGRNWAFDLVWGNRSV